MNRPENPSTLMAIPDVQSGSDERNLAIDQVGIRGLRYPLAFADGDAPAQSTIGTFAVMVALPEDRKGTHMSRLIEMLEEQTAPGAAPLSVPGMRALLDQLVVRLDAPAGRIEVAFPWFVRKTAPISGVASLLDYEVRLAAELQGDRYASLVTVAVPVTSLCPCSKEISEYGAHNQRSTITISVRPREPVRLAVLLRVAAPAASSERYGIRKRAAEKYLTERAYDNPRFVEDLVRGVAARLAADRRFAGFAVEAENFESIHNHSAFARIARGLGV